MAQAEPIKDAMRYIREHGIVRPRELEAISVPRVYFPGSFNKAKSSGWDAASIRSLTPPLRTAYLCRSSQTSA